MESIFQIRDKVYDIFEGWGVISDISETSLTVSFTKNDGTTEAEYTLDGKVFDDDLIPRLSLSEYTFNGFSQDRKATYVGKWCHVWSSPEDIGKRADIRKITGIFEDRFLTETTDSWLYAEPLSDKILIELGLVNS